VKKSLGKSRFAGLVQQAKRPEEAIRKRQQQGVDSPEGDIGKRARGHVQVSALVPPQIRDDLKVALALDPDQRDLSDLITDLLTEWMDSLPSNFQAVRPSKRLDK